MVGYLGLQDEVISVAEINIITQLRYLSAELKLGSVEYLVLSKGY